MKINNWLLGFAFVCSFGQLAQAGLIEYVTPEEAKTVGGSVSAKADFTLGNGYLTLTLINDSTNPFADSQLISGISFNIKGASGSGLLTSVNKASTTINIDGKGNSTIASKDDPLTRWQAKESDNQIQLTTLSGKTPELLIIGPGEKGTGIYSNANPSITGVHNPSILDTATFQIKIEGVTASSTISDVSMLFGTNGFGTENETVEMTRSDDKSDDNSDGGSDGNYGGSSSGTSGAATSVPEPSSLALLGLGGLVIAIRSSRRGRKLAV